VSAPKAASAVGILVSTGVGLALGISVLGMATFGVFIVPLSKAFHWGRGDISLANTIMCYAVAALSPFSGHLIDRYGVRRTLLPSILLFGLSMIGLSLLNSSLVTYYLAYLGVAVTGVGTAPPSYSRVVVLWFRERRGLALGAALAGVGVGTALMPNLLQTVISRLGWRQAFLCDAALVLGLSWPMAFLFIREPGVIDGASGAASGQEGFTLRQALGRRAFWQMLLAFVLLGTFTAGVVSHLVPLLRDRGVAPETAASALSLLGVALIIGRVCTGYVLDKVFAPLVAAVCVGVAAVGLGLLRAGDGGGSALLAVSLMGFAIGAELDFMSYLIAAYLGVKSYGRIYGVFYGVFILGSGMGPVLMGYSQQRASNYTPALSLLLGGLVLAIPAFLTLGKYPGSQLSNARMLSP
jgi:MFS family permease